MIKTLGLSLLEKATNRYIALDPETQEKLQQLNGKIICINVKGLPFECCLFLEITQHGFNFSMPKRHRPTPNATISATILSFLRLGLLPTDHRLFGEDVNIEGDLNVGTNIKHILDTMDIDWEEHLSTIIGDIAAERVGRFAKKTKTKLKDTVNATGENITEYLQDEISVLPTRIEIDDFCQQVDNLRHDIARFEQQLTQLEKN